jgi:hypothetical protein
MAYIYRHIRKDKNQPFYIGIGSDLKYKRANEKSRRNNMWYKISNKTGYEVQILFDNITWKEACEKENEFIKLYGRIDIGTGILCNMTDGGDGIVGFLFTDEIKEKISNKLKGIKRSDETRKKISLNSKRRRLTQKEKTHLSKLHKGEKKSDSVKNNMSIAQQKLSDVKRERMLNNCNWSKLVFDTQTGIFYNSIKQASIIYGFSHSYLKYMLSGKRRNKTNLIYA